VPGSFELPMVAKMMAKSGKYDAIVGIGAVIMVREVHSCEPFGFYSILGYAPERRGN
jgi:hypothetical protein